MSIADDLTTRYAADLRGFGAALPDDFATGVRAMATLLPETAVEAWAKAGVELANSSLRAWEAAAEYFRASPALVDRLGVEGIARWVVLATDLSSRSSLIAAQFLKSTPDALAVLQPDDLDEWAQQGDRLCRGNWKSIALSQLYFQVSPALFQSLPLASVSRLVDIVDQLTERSYEVATTALEGAVQIFAGLPAVDREPFLRFARAVTRASWADTRLYFERGPRLLDRIESSQRTAFLDLAGRVTTEVGRQGFPLFSDAAEALGGLPLEQHSAYIAFAARIAAGSPTAAMEYLKSAAFVATRLNPDQRSLWEREGLEIVTVERNPEGAEAYFRLESTRAEERMRALSTRVELASINSMLRMYAKALSGEPVSVQSAEELVDRGIGWVTESTPTTEGSTIYLPPYVATFEEQEANFQVYKVFTTHQTGRMEFGSFDYAWDVPGTYVAATGPRREVAATMRREERGIAAAKAEAVTAVQRLFNCFDDRALIAGLFTVVEDTRIDALVAREYGGIRRWLRQLQEHEIVRRPKVEEMALRQAFVENLLRASLGMPEAIRWPVMLREYMTEGIAALRMVEQRGATVQDSAEVAGALYDIAASIPNVRAPMPDGKFDFEGATQEMMDVLPSMPGGGDGPDMPSNSQEAAFENPPQPDFRGDFKPELVQLMAKLKLQQEGGVDPGGALTKEQLMELLQNSTELSIAELADGDIDQSLGMFLDNLQKDAGMPASDKKGEKKDGDSDATDGGDGEGPDEGEMPVEITWFYYDEWDFRAGDYRPRWTRVGERFSAEGDREFYEETLRRHHGLVMETRRQFEMMRPESFKKIKRLEDGDELDTDLAIEFHVDKKAGAGPTQRIYNRRNKIERDVAVAFLLDMSASTDEEIEKQKVKHSKDDDDDDFDGDPRRYFQWLAARRAQAMIEPPKRIIDLEKESTVLIVEALEAIGDAYGIFGFSGYGRDNVEFHVIKNLDEQMSDRVQRRISKIEPIRSTRMGPAIRHTIHKLEEYDAKVKILILVSDGRPQDHGYGRDRTEKEYAVHDTKQALVEAKRLGITPFLITVDKEGHDYLKQMCDDIGYEVVDDIESLPRRLPTLYRHLAAD
ncbi:MAG: VWA domain-containing protein [Chloroflexi bacterium]|nr:VWA domain-containing protein [Chloroflexota bacterium]